MRAAAGAEMALIRLIACCFQNQIKNFAAPIALRWGKGRWRMGCLRGAGYGRGVHAGGP